MCFSAEASFGVGAAVAVIGGVAFSKADTTAQKVFATIPFFFALQQCLEGVLWLSLTDNFYHEWERIATYGFLVFAWIVWPVYIPLSLVMLEAKPVRKRWLVAFTVIGSFVSMVLAYRLFFHDVHATIQGYHIRYEIEYTFQYPAVIGILYFVPIVVSLFVSSVKRMFYVAIVIMVAFLVSAIFYTQHLISVWCFFSAVTSLAVLWVLLGVRRSKEAWVRITRN